MDNKADLSAGHFTVIGTSGADVKKPVVDVSTLKVSDTAVVAGESVTISVKVTDAVGINSVSLYYILPVTGNTDYRRIDRDNDTGMHEGMINVSNSTESGEWQVDYIYATDSSSNSAAVYDLER